MENIKIYHLTKIIDEKVVIQIIVDYPSDYEFSLDFDLFKKNVKQISTQIKEYINKNIDDKKAALVLLVLNGVIIGSLISSDINKINSSSETSQTSKSEYSQIIDKTNSIDFLENKTEPPKSLLAKEPNSDNTILILSKTEQNTSEPLVQELKNTEQKNIETTQPSKISTTSTSKSITKESINPVKTATTTATPTTPSTPTTATISAVTVTPATTTAVIQGETINVKLHSGQIVTISMNEYITGVVSAEMPASFQSEALKAQAIAARTYTYKKLASGTITMIAGTANQEYKTEEELRATWGNSYDTYYTKIKNAVLATNGQYITYNGKYIDALYFSTSNGKTEDPIFVWGNSFDYLKSVDSPWDVGVSGYTSTKSFTYSELTTKLGVNLTNTSEIKVIDKTTGDRVKTATFSGKILSGVKVRELLGLKSADFDISVNLDSVTFTTRGYGHGVGMSQYGANGMAKAGFNYIEILKHYYTNIEIKTK